MNREELIEEAADAMFTANDGQPDQGYEDMARAALAVFEQAHTPKVIERHDLVMPIYEDTPTDDELWDTYRDAVDLAMHRANIRDGFASNMSRESIVAGLRAVAGFRCSDTAEAS